jgi:hypothetical protein
LPASGLGAGRPVGDVHDYTGSLSGGSALNAGTDRHGFVSEFGAWSANFSAAAFEHDWHANTHLVATQEAYAGQMARYDDFPTWCFAGQLWAAWHVKVITEKARRHRFAPSVAVRYHFFLDHFGHGGAGVVDRWRGVGPAYRGLAAANRPLLPLAPVPAGGRVRPGERLRIPITVINDRHDRSRPARLRWWLSALSADEAFLVGRDTPAARGPLQAEIAPLDQVAILPRRPGTARREGAVELVIEPDSAREVAVVEWVADQPGPAALFFELADPADPDGAPILNWMSFMVADDDWRPEPGLAEPRRFTVVGADGRPPAQPLQRRWSAEQVDPANAAPDQYLLGGRPLDVFDDVTLAGDGTALGPPLPFPDPLRAMPELAAGIRLTDDPRSRSNLLSPD